MTHWRLSRIETLSAFTNGKYVVGLGRVRLRVEFEVVSTNHLTPTPQWRD